jgi:glycine/D-amino acid oxidase-like deaminating enzyme
MGSSSAYNLLLQDPSLKVAVVERDPTYKMASTPLSVGSIRQQFSIEGNVRMSQYSADFIKNVDTHLSVPGEDPADCSFVEGGYLFLASDAGLPTLKENHALQASLGAGVEMMDRRGLATKFPWLDVEDIEAGVLGTRDEGWFDPWLLLTGFRRKAASLGAVYVQGNVEAFRSASSGGGTRLESVRVAPSSGSSSTDADGEAFDLECGFVVNAAGAWAADVMRMADGSDFPVRPRRRMAFVVHCPDGPVDDCPLVVDPSGVYFRREGAGGHFVCGKSPPDTPEDDPDGAPLEVDHAFFTEQIWPALARRAPAFEACKQTSAWAGYYEYNTFDQNAILGKHPTFENLVLANGFSGHGIQQSPAVGRAVAEVVLHGGYRTLDLEPFGYARVLEGRKLQEKNVV